VRRRTALWVALMGLAGFGPAAAAAQAPGFQPPADDMVVTAQVSSAEHETIEGYFTFGDSLAVMVKPGTELHRFLIRQRGKRMRITFAPDGRDGASRVIRED
jgi:hypothetical protein